MESDKLKTGDLVLRNDNPFHLADRSDVRDRILILWANNYIFVSYNRYGQKISHPQCLAKDYQILQRINNMYGGQDAV
jgi:hypothetical protein